MMHEGVCCASLTWASFLQRQDLQVKAVEHGQVFLPEEQHAPLHGLDLTREVALITHAGVCKNKKIFQKISHKQESVFNLHVGQLILRDLY